MSQFGRPTSSESLEAPESSNASQLSLAISDKASDLEIVTIGTENDSVDDFDDDLNDFLLIDIAYEIQNVAAGIQEALTLNSQKETSNKVDLTPRRYSEEEKRAISGEWRLTSSGDSESDVFYLKFHGDALVFSQKHLGIDQFPKFAENEKWHLENGRLHRSITNSEVISTHVYDKVVLSLPYHLSIEQNISGTWKVRSIENFEEFRRFRSLRKEQEFLWQFGHAFYQLRGDKLTRGSVINGQQKDFSTISLNDPIVEGFMTKVTFIRDNQLITICTSSDADSEGPKDITDKEYKWRINRYFQNGLLHVAHCYPNGTVCTRVLERV